MHLTSDTSTLDDLRRVLPGFWHRMITHEEIACEFRVVQMTPPGSDPQRTDRDYFDLVRFEILSDSMCQTVFV